MLTMLILKNPSQNAGFSSQTRLKLQDFLGLSCQTLGIRFATPTPHTRQKYEQTYGPQTAKFALF